MSMENKIADIKALIHDMSRNIKWKKLNKDREEQVKLQAALAKCRGQMEACLKDFNRTIRQQARSIAEGKAMGAETTINEQIMWDSAIGYMLVKDALFSLKSISTQDSVSHAYEMLDAAIDLMTGKQKTFVLPKLGGNRERNAYGYITSEGALRQKNDYLDTFFEKLKETGDIEGCLAISRGVAEVDADRLSAYAAALDSAKDIDESAPEIDDFDADAYSALLDMTPPTK